MGNYTEKLVGSVKELNELAIKTIEEIAEIQLNSIQQNTKTNVDSLKSATEIKDIDSLQGYLKEQLDAAQNISVTVSEDAKKIAMIGENYANGVKTLIEKSIKVS